ncbi:MAG: hypothetical protein IIV90_03555, partial [Oscillospiraceae bacterium]|nr:hypothetical protein [Oscillospiraceae bacterium]
VLTKESGLIFALWGLGIILWDSFNRGQLLLKKLPLKQKLMPQRGWGIVLGSVLAAKLSWSAVLAANGQGGGSGHLVQNLLSLAGPWSDRTAVTVGAFFRKMMLYPEMDAPLRLSPVMWVVVGAALLGLAAARVPEKRNALRRLRIGLVAGFAVYALGLLYLYLFSFGEYEGTRVFSFWRYLGSWVLAMALLGVGLLLEQAARAENHISELPVLLLAAVLLVFPFNTKQVNNLVSPATQIVQDQALRNAYPAAAWFENGLTPEDRVYFVADDTAVYEKLCAAYSLYPYRCDSTAGYNFDTTGNNAMYANEVTAEEWAAALQEDGYTYVYLYAISDHFLADYITLFEEPSDVAARALFRVETAGDGVTLVRAN